LKEEKKREIGVYLVVIFYVIRKEDQRSKLKENDLEEDKRVIILK
jgi:hypothetical protein